MTDWILTLNAGSSSLKFAVFEVASAGPVLRAGGQIEGIGTSPHLVLRSGHGEVLDERRLTIAETERPATTLGWAIAALLDNVPQARLTAVGHRVVHGGPGYGTPVQVDDIVLAELRRLAPLAPLHQPHNIAGIESCKVQFPDAMQIACFDTAFHRTHSWVADTFALPRAYYDKGVRRYGFHGLSYESVMQQLRTSAPAAVSGRLVVGHLGAGASMCAIRDGRSIGSTMGFSALDGLPMGTRCGQLDPGVVLYLIEEEGMNSREIADLLYRQSGLKGLSGLSGDVRDLEAAGSVAAEQAMDYFACRTIREVGALAATLGGLESLVFCGGIGENSWRMRDRICRDLDWLGVRLEEAANRSARFVISSDSSRVKVFVVRTNEEAVIARHVLSCLGLRSAQSPSLVS
ncbi:MAG: acetate/propionate family kinase [Hyphomicrobium sp.]|jgi:acetate kinase|nr:acetate/propionate family kinase [Hyphomicrobium sp.]